MAISALVLVSAVSANAMADSDGVLGAVVGGSAGALIGHAVHGRNGALVGGALGAITGVALSDSSRSYQPYPYQGSTVVYPQSVVRERVIYPSYYPDNVVVVRPYQPPRVVYVNDDGYRAYPPAWRVHYAYGDYDNGWHRGYYGARDYNRGHEHEHWHGYDHDD
jgi:hypothetical protein